MSPAWECTEGETHSSRRTQAGVCKGRVVARILERADCGLSRSPGLSVGGGGGGEGGGGGRREEQSDCS